MKYRKENYVVEAVRWRGDRVSEFPGWLKEAFDNNTIVQENNKLNIQTNNGVVQADPGDYIVHEVNGNIYPCKPDIFEKTYQWIPNNK